MAVVAMLVAVVAVVATLACRAVAEPPPSERSALLAFLAATPHERRLEWNSSTPVCGWVGVTCDAANSTVVEVRLPGVGLIGAIPPATLGRLPNLQVLSLRSNRILGSIPDDVLQLSSLRSLFLQNNLLSGAIPAGLSKLGTLERLVLSHNNLSDSIPFALNNLTALRALRLDGNHLSGNIPSISIPGLIAFNVSDNNLNGSIPQSLARFPADSFAGNLQLCGEPLPPCPFPPSPSPAPGMSPGGSSKKRKLSSAAKVGIVVGAVVVALLLLAAIVLCAVSRRRRGTHEGQKGTTATAAAAARAVAPPASGEGTGMTSSSKEDMGGGASGSAAASAVEPSRLVFVGKGAGYSFDLEDLLRASAEVLGKGGVGTSYKAVLEEGTTVVVKRLKDVAVARREFDAHMDALGKVEHRNALPVRAYYFSKDEKLLVYDYLPNGSLSAMLHGQYRTNHLHRIALHHSTFTVSRRTPRREFGRFCGRTRGVTALLARDFACGDLRVARRLGDLKFPSLSRIGIVRRDRDGHELAAFAEIPSRHCARNSPRSDLKSHTSDDGRRTVRASSVRCASHRPRPRA